MEIEIHQGPLTEEAVEAAASLIDACFGATYGATVGERLAHVHKPMLVLARQERIPVGFKLGFERGPREFYSWLGGVHPEQRRRGVAQELMRRQHAWCRDAGYRFATTETLSDNAGMLILNLKSGFRITGTKLDERGLKVLLTRRLDLLQ